MEINRKRVARRLVSGLVAGALALGGLAISGGSVSAKTPVTAAKRIQGTDRYATAVALASKYVDNAAPASSWSTNANLVVASGESAADALSASALAALVKAPILLTKSNELPSSVRDWLLTRQSTFTASTSGKVYVVGGTAAVSDDVVTAILSSINTATDTTPHSSVRVAGDDRYATAAAVNAVSGVLNGTDAVVLVSGTNWADAVSVAPLAFKQGWPIIPINGTLDSNAVATITSYLTLAGVTAGRSNGKVLIVGGPAAVPTSVENELVGAGFEYSKITRIMGADRYQTGLALNAELLTGIHSATLTGQEVVLATGESFADALASAPFVGLNGYHLQLTNSTSLNPSAAALMQTLAAEDTLKTPNTVWTVGGVSAVADAVVTQAVESAQVTNISPLAMACQEGSDLVVLAISEDYTGYAADTVGSVPSASEQSAILAAFAKDGVALTAGAAPSSAIFYDADGNTLIDSILVTFPAPLTVPNLGSTTYSFLGMTEAAGANKRSIAPASCTLNDDVVPPVITSISAPQSTGGANKTFIVNASEEVVCTEAATDETKLSVNGVSATAAAVDITIAKRTATSCAITFTAGTTNAPYNAAMVVGHAIEIAAGFIKDVAGNANAAPATGSVTSDVVKPTATGTVTCLPAAQATGITSTNGLKVTAKSFLKGGSKDGVAGNGYKLSVVSQRGLFIPTVAVDDTAKTIVVTVDSTYHYYSDVVAAVANGGGNSDWKFEIAGTGADLIAATVVPVTLASGTQSCTVTLTGSELITAATITSLTVNGITVAPGAAPAVNTAMTKATFSMAPTTSVVSGSIAILGTMTDIAGNANSTLSLAI